MAAAASVLGTHEFYSDEYKLDPDMTQLSVHGIDRIEQHMRLITIEAGVDFSQKHWRQHNLGAAYAPLANKDAYALGPLEPVFRVTGKYYDTHLKQYSGAPEDPSAPMTVSQRVIGCFNDLPIQDTDTRERRALLKATDRFHSRVWAVIRADTNPDINRHAGGKNANDVPDDADLDAYFQAERNRTYTPVFQGVTIYKTDQQLRANNALAVQIEGVTTVVNWSDSHLVNGDKIRFIPPRVGHEYVKTESGGWLFRYIVELGNASGVPQRPADRLPAAVYKIRNTQKEPYHAEVLKAAGPGDPVKIRLLRDGQDVAQNKFD